MSAWRWIGTVLVAASLLAPGCTLQEPEARIPVTTASDEARELYEDGVDALDALRTADAHVLFTRAGALDPGFARAYLEMARTTTNPTVFRAALEQAVTAAGGVSEGERKMILGFRAGVNGDTTTELQNYRALVRLYPDDERAHLLLGDFYAEHDNAQEAITAYKRAAEIDPELAAAYSRMGRTYQSLGRVRQAEEALERFVELAPDEPAAHVLLATVLMKAGRFDASTEVFRRVLEIDPGNTDALIGVGNNLMFQEKPDEAREAFSLLRDAADARGRQGALVWLAATHVHEADHERALGLLEQARVLAEQNRDGRGAARILELMGHVLLDAGRGEAAATRFDRALATLDEAEVPQDVLAAARATHLYDQARVAIVRGDLAAARAKLTEYRGALPRGEASTGKDRFNELSGLIALAEDDYRKAIRFLQRANQNDPRIHFLTAVAYGKFGRAAEARAACERALNFNEPRFELALIRPKARRLLEEL